MANNILKKNNKSYYTAIWCETLDKHNEKFNTQEQELLTIQLKNKYFVNLKANQAIEYCVRFGRKYTNFDDLKIELEKIRLNILYCCNATNKKGYTRKRILNKFVYDIPNPNITDDLKKHILLVANYVIDGYFHKAYDLIKYVIDNFSKKDIIVKQLSDNIT